MGFSFENLINIIYLGQPKLLSWDFDQPQYMIHKSLWEMWILLESNVLKAFKLQRQIKFHKHCVVYFSNKTIFFSQMCFNNTISNNTSTKPWEKNVNQIEMLWWWIVGFYGLQTMCMVKFFEWQKKKWSFNNTSWNNAILMFMLKHQWYVFNCVFLRNPIATKLQFK